MRQSEGSLHRRTSGRLHTSMLDSATSVPGMSMSSPSLIKGMPGRRAVLTSVVCLMMASGCALPPEQGKSPRKEQLDALVKEKATVQDVIDRLGPFTVYEKGTEGWEELLQVLGPAGNPYLRSVREAAARHPKVLFSTTDRTMTWLFFNDTDTLEEYHLAAQ